MTVLLLLIAVVAVIVWCSRSLPWQLKLLCFVFLIVAVILLVVPLGGLPGRLLW